MGDRILRTRVASVHGNLQQVQNLLQRIQAQRREVNELQRLLVGKESQFNKQVSTIDFSVQLLDVVANIVMEGEQLDERRATTLLHAVQDIHEATEALKAHLNEVAERLTAHYGRLTPIDAKQGFGRRLNEALIEPSEQWSVGLAEIENGLLQKVAEACVVPEEGDGPGNEESALQPWMEYEKWKMELAPIFVDYVDFMRGLALRDVGFDAGICQIADDLFGDSLRVAGVNSWDSLTILTREEAQKLTGAHIIRLQFPEWSVWSLPLVAHEFGHVVIDKMVRPDKENGEVRPSSESIDLVQFVNQGRQYGWSEALRLDLFADAFATYALGPAYAFAAILLRLDPLQAREASRRVTAILEMLAWMNGQSKSDDLYGTFKTDLQQEWDDALAQAGQSVVLDGDERKELERLARLVGTSGYLQGVAYTRADWDSISDWPNLTEPEKVDAVRLADHQLRDVLNAAWKDRWEKEEAREEIATSVHLLWEKLSRPSPAGERDHQAGAQLDRVSQGGSYVSR